MMDMEVDAVGASKEEELVFIEGERLDDFNLDLQGLEEDRELCAISEEKDNTMTLQKSSSH